jgi:protein involved in polysaccharide export with SLBB domain
VRLLRFFAWILLAPAASPAWSADAPSLFETSRRAQGASSGQDVIDQAIPQGPVGWSLEAPIDPDSYRLIPGDLLHLGLWGSATKGYSLVVTPEGSLILPDFGPVSVSGLTIRAAEELLAVRLRPLYNGTRLSLRLLSPGHFRVQVTGMVEKPGIYDFTRLDHLTAAIESAGGIRNGGSVRRIRLRAPESSPTGVPASPAEEARPGDDPEREIDLAPWLLRGETAANPLLLPGCAVEVPGVNATVRVRGPVNGRAGLEVPGTSNVRLPDRPEEEPNRVAELIDGDTVGSLLDFMGGLSERASGTGTLYREGSAPLALNLKANDARATPLLAGDILEVGYAARWVYVIGAVRSPGRYPFLPGLMAPDYINMAGGPTELGRSAWSVLPDPENKRPVEHDGPLYAGVTVKVPERRAYKFTTILAPLTAATAFVISIFAVANL